MSLVLEVRCIRLRWISFFYPCTFIFVLDLFVSLWHDVQKESGYILSFTPSQKFVVSPANNDLMDLGLNLWCNNSKAIFFLAGNFFSLTYPWFSLEMHVSFVHCVVMLLIFSSLLQITLCKTLCEKDKYVLHSLT